MRKISSLATRRLDGLPIRGRSTLTALHRAAGRAHREMSAPRSPHLARFLPVQLTPLTPIEQRFEPHLPYPLQHLRPAHRPPPFRALLKPDRSRATKTGQLTSQLQPLNADYLTDGLGANLDGTLAEYTVLSEEALVPNARPLIADRPRHYGRVDQRRLPRRLRGDESSHPEPQPAVVAKPCPSPWPGDRRPRVALAAMKPRRNR